MPRWAICAVPFALVLLAGCVTESDLARRRLQAARQFSLGSWMPVQRADFPAGEPLQGKPTTPGSLALQNAAIADPDVLAFVREHGVPNAIAIVGGQAYSVDLAYSGERTAYSLTNGQGVTGQRALIDAEVDLIDPDRLLDGQAQRLQSNVDAAARVITVGRRVLLAMPPPGTPSPSGEFYGALWPKASPISAHLFGHPPDANGRVVAWVHPDGPVAGQLQLGDRITAVEGSPIALFESEGRQWSGPMTLTVERDGASRTVRVQPEAWPRRIIFIALPDDTPNAHAVDEGVGVTTAMLDLVPNDDALAWVIGHELAHISLGHTQKKVTAGTVLKGIVGYGVLLPAQIVVPGSGVLLGGLMQGVENRFNRDQERDADRLGIHYARAAGYDPAAALIALDTLETKVPVGTVTQFLDVHPPYPERRQLVTAEIATATP